MKALIFFSILFFVFSVEAYLTSDFDVTIGYTDLSIKAGTDFNRTLSSFTFLELNYNLNIAGPSLTINLSFNEIVNSNLGNMPYTRLGLGVRWYPLGLNGQRIILDNQVVAKKWEPSPFMALSAGLASMSVVSTVESDKEHFNAAMVDYFFKFGNEIPIAADWLLIGQLGYLFGSSSAASSDSAINLKNTSLQYSGMVIFCGVKLTTF